MIELVSFDILEIAMPLLTSILPVGLPFQSCFNYCNVSMSATIKGNSGKWQNRSPNYIIHVSSSRSVKALPQSNLIT